MSFFLIRLRKNRYNKSQQYLGTFKGGTSRCFSCSSKYFG